MSLFASYEIENDEAFFAQIQAALSVVDDLRGPFGEILRDFFDSNQAIFGNKPGLYDDYADTTTGETGTNTPYAKKKQALYGRVYPMLVASGRLRDSLTGTPNEDSIAIIGKRGMAVGTDVDYGIYHQSDEDRKKMPLRKFLFIGPEAARYAPKEKGRARRYANIIEKWVIADLKRIYGK